MLWRPSKLIEPCLPWPAKAPPSGPGWLHEIKHEGFRILARRDAAGVRLITRAGNDFSSRGGALVAALMASRQTAGPLQVCRLGEATPAAPAPFGHAGTRLVQCVIAYRQKARWVDG
jgi:ATP-dependent DNA ligase